MLEAVGVALFAGERAELAAQDAVVGVIDVAIDDVAGAVAGFALAGQVRDGADGVQVLRFKQPERVGLGNAFARGDLVVKVAQSAALGEKIHRPKLKCGNTTSATVTTRNTMLIRAFSRKNAVLIHFRLRRRASQCSSSRLSKITNSPAKYATRNPESNPNAEQQAPHQHVREKGGAPGRSSAPSARPANAGRARGRIHNPATRR